MIIASNVYTRITRYVPVTQFDDVWCNFTSKHDSLKWTFAAPTTQLLNSAFAVKVDTQIYCYTECIKDLVLGYNCSQFVEIQEFL